MSNELNLKNNKTFVCFIIHLGYSVFSYVSSSVGDIGLLINLQSERDSVYLENRVEAFLIRAQVNIFMFIS